jgi:drug/metabolite transporter (DMT)-like permease
MVELFIITALMSIAFFAITSIISKYLIPVVGPFHFLAYQLYMGFILLILISIYEIFTGFQIEKILNFEIILLIFFNAIFTFLGYTTLMIGFNKGNASVGGIILSSRIFASIPLGFLIIGERYPDVTYFFIIMTLFGSILVSWERDLKLIKLFTLQAPGIRYFLATALFWGIANVLIRKLGGELPPFIFLTIRQAIMILCMLVLLKVGKKKLDLRRAPINVRLLRQIFVYVSILLAAQALFVYSLGVSLTITEGIGIAEGTFTLLFSIVIARFIDNSLLKEPLDKQSLLVRLAGTLLAATGTFGIIDFKG